MWATPLPSYPTRAESHPRDDKIVLLDEDGATVLIVGLSRDRPPRVESLVKDDVGFAAIAALPVPHVAALSSRACRLLILDAATGAIVSQTNASLRHHGKGSVAKKFRSNNKYYYQQRGEFEAREFDRVSLRLEC